MPEGGLLAAGPPNPRGAAPVIGSAGRGGAGLARAAFPREFPSGGGRGAFALGAAGVLPARGRRALRRGRRREERGKRPRESVSLCIRLRAEAATVAGRRGEGEKRLRGGGGGGGGGTPRHFAAEVGSGARRAVAGGAGGRLPGTGGQWITRGHRGEGRVAAGGKKSCRRRPAGRLVVPAFPGAPRIAAAPPRRTAPGRRRGSPGCCTQVLATFPLFGAGLRWRGLCQRENADFSTRWSRRCPSWWLCSSGAGLRAGPPPIRVCVRV